MKKNYLLYSFVFIVIVLTAADIITPTKEFSDLENRNLKQEVKFNFKDFFKNTFQSNYETYINDQFILRDNWITLKAISESALAKVENNGIIFGQNEYLFEKFSGYDNDRFNGNINAINIFKEKVDSNVSVMIAPNSYEIYHDYLPISAPVIEQSTKIDYIYKNLTGINTVNIVDVMNQNKENYIYYRTDHHWTTYGAYLAYKEFINSVQGTPVNLADLKEIQVSDFYGTYFSKAKPINIDPDILTYYDIHGITMNIYGEDYDSLYDYSALDLRDKYSLFLRGNNALTVIKNNNLNNGKKLLVFKDSFANSMIPFLTQNYEEIHVIDLRSFKENPAKYVNENKFDDVLILYNFATFAKDINVLKLKY